MPSHLLSNHNPGKFCHQIHFWKFVCPAGYHRKHNYCRLHFSGSMSAVFLLDLVSSRPWQGSRQWEKGRIQSPSLSEVESLTIAVLPNLQGWRSLVLPSPSSGSTTSSPSHSDLGAIVVFCFLISESPYRFSVVCLSSFLICVISSLYQAISDYYLRVVFLIGLFTGCEVLEMTMSNIAHTFLTAIYCINCLSLLSFSSKCEMGRDDETSVGTVFLLIYLSENCQKGRSTKYQFVIMSIWENKAIKSLDRKSSGIFGYQLLSNDKISKKSKWLVGQLYHKMPTLSFPQCST